MVGLYGIGKSRSGYEDALTCAEILQREALPPLSFAVQNIVVTPESRQLGLRIVPMAPAPLDRSQHHSYPAASCAIFRISTGAIDPEIVAITTSRSKVKPSIGRVTRPYAVADRSGRMHVA